MGEKPSMYDQVMPVFKKFADLFRDITAQKPLSQYPYTCGGGMKWQVEAFSVAENFCSNLAAWSDENSADEEGEEEGDGFSMSGQGLSSDSWKDEETAAAAAE